jgi:hypothetical protein
MTKRLTIVILAALALGAVAAGTTFAVKALSIYRNDMDSAAKRGQMVGIAGQNCDRGGSPRAFKITVGKRTKECSYRTPVVGRDLEIIATGRLLSGTPKTKRPRTYIALILRSGGGARYQLTVFPRQRKYQLRKILRNGTTRYLAIGKGIRRIQGINKANVMRLRAFNLTSTPEKDDSRLLVYINKKRMAVVTDRSAGPIKGRFSGVAVGSRKIASGAVGSFDDVIVRVPSPF